jgi:hypothetical protein
VGWGGGGGKISYPKLAFPISNMPDDTNISLGHGEKKKRKKKKNKNIF